MTILVVFHFDTKNPRLPCHPATLTKEFCGLCWSFTPSIVREKHQTFLAFDVGCATAPQAIPDWNCDATIDVKLLPVVSDSEKIVLQRRHVFNNGSKSVPLRVLFDKLPKGFDDDGRYAVQLCVVMNSLSDLRPIPVFDFSAPSLQSNTAVDVGKRTFYVNKDFLSVYSTVLAEFLRSGEEGHVVIEDVLEEDFQMMLENLYPSRKPVTVSNVVPLLRMADRFSVAILFDETNKYLHESFDCGRMERSQILDLAVCYQLNALQEKILHSLRDPDAIAALTGEVSYHGMSSETRALLFDNVIHMLPKQKSSGLFGSLLRNSRRKASTASITPSEAFLPKEVPCEKKEKPALPPKPPRMAPKTPVA